MIKTTLTAVLAIAGLATLPHAFAEIDPRGADLDMYPDTVRYNPDIPRPADVLGFELGSEPVRHHQLVDYITTVASLSDRLSLEVIGYSHERRPILFVVATAAENHARLDSIRADHVAISEPSTQQPDLETLPVVSWLNYGVHGAESSGMDAALPFIYHLAAAEGDDIERLLAESVILVTAIFNPDGHSKRVAWFDAYGGQRDIADPAHIEHQFNWQRARTNHYHFDLNRQWLLQTQPEAVAWMRKWHEWRPNLTVDYHEMGSDQTYYFHPGAATRTNPLVPDEAERLLASVVAGSEALLDAEGRLYFHGERFDNYYVGKGSTFPLINGGVGVLFEAAAALGREIETPNGLRTYRENIRKHFRTSIASAESAVDMRRDLLRYQQQFYRQALDDASRHATKAWVVAAPGDPVRLNFFADLLASHRINAYRPARDIESGGTTFGAGESLIVPANQPQHRLIRSIFEPVSEFEDATFYDVSTWTMPPAFDFDVAGLGSREFRANLLGPRFTGGPIAADPPAESGYGYLFEWGSYYAPRALQRILERGLLARVAKQPYTATTSTGVVEFARGSILVPLDRQETDRAEIHRLMQTIASDDGIAVHALTSGRSATGTQGIDAGGASFRALKLPSVLLVTGNDIDLYEAGEIWHLLDFRMHMPVTLRERDTLAGIDWDRYTHIVFPSGTYEEYEPEYLDRLRLWVNEGGTAIGMRDAAFWLRAQTIDWVDPLSEEGLLAAADEDATEEAAEEAAEEAPERTPYADKDKAEAADIIGGAIFSVDLDVSHPLGFGYARRAIALHKNVEEPMTVTNNPFAVVAAYADDPVYSGYVSESNRDALAGTPSLIAERSATGSVILFADNPNFRGYWYGTNKLFLNAVFFSRIFDAPVED